MNTAELLDLFQLSDTAGNGRGTEAVRPLIHTAHVHTTPVSFELAEYDYYMYVVYVQWTNNV